MKKTKKHTRKVKPFTNPLTLCMRNMERLTNAVDHLMTRMDNITSEMDRMTSRLSGAVSNHALVTLSNNVAAMAQTQTQMQQHLYEFESSLQFYDLYKKRRKHPFLRQKKDTVTVQQIKVVR